MKVTEFNIAIEKNMWPHLQRLNFIQHRGSFIYTTDINQLVLFRVSDKYSGLCQYTDFSLCFRHTFLRDVWGKVPELIPKEWSSFPFRIKPSLLSKKWTYRFVLNPDESDRLEYGRAHDLDTALTLLGEDIKNNFQRWITLFTPQDSLRLIQHRGDDTFIERLWIEDYQAYLK